MICGIFFESFDVFSRAELESRAEIKYEIYSKAINIEAKTMIDMATKQIIPAVIRYTTVLGESINTVKTAGEGLIDVSVQLDLLKKASKLLKASNSAMSKLLGCHVDHCLCFNIDCFRINLIFNLCT